MKIYSLVMLIFIFKSHSQDLNIKSKMDSTFVLSKYANVDFDQKGNKIRKILNENEESLIVKLESNKYISFSKNKITCFTICNDSIINKVKLNEIDAMKCEVLLDTLVNINPKNLTNEIDVNGDKITVHDGNEIQINIYKDNKTIKLYSYATEVFMEESRFIFAKSRSTFLNSYLELKKYFYDKNYKRLKELDTIYLFIEKSKNIKIIIDENKLKNTIQENYFFNFNCASGQFTNFYHKLDTKSKNTFYENKKFLKMNKNKIINIEFLKKFIQYDLIDIINSNKKNVFIIEKSEIKKGKLKIKKVKGGVFSLF